MLKFDEFSAQVCSATGCLFVVVVKGLAFIERPQKTPDNLLVVALCCVVGGVVVPLVVAVVFVFAVVKAEVFSAEVEADMISAAALGGTDTVAVSITVGLESACLVLTEMSIPILPSAECVCVLGVSGDVIDMVSLGDGLYCSDINTGMAH